MSTYLLVHGIWHGVWCRDKVVPLLRQAGHIVVAPNLSDYGQDTPSPEERPEERSIPRI